MSKLKKILAVGLFLSASFFMGCDEITGGTNDDTITPGTLTTDNDTITLQTELTVSLEIEASSDISSSAFSVAFTKGGTATTKLSATVAYTTDDKGTATITVTPASDCPTGLYTGTITIVNGEATGIKTFTVYVKGVDEVTFDLDTASYTMGSFNSSTGSNIDLDAGTVYSSSQVDATAKTVIDLFYFTKDGTDYLYSPSIAQNVVTGTNATLIADVTINVDFDAIETQSEIDALWSLYGGSTLAQKLPAATNDVFLVKTIDSGEVFLLKVTGQVPGIDGTITVKAAK